MFYGILSPVEMFIGILSHHNISLAVFQDQASNFTKWNQLSITIIEIFYKAI